MAQEYFYNASSTAAELKVLKSKYNAVVKAALEIGKLLSQYVCVKGKWNDENAIIFADWWNQNKTGGAGGDLKWDATNKLLYMSKQVGSLSDGEDKIRSLVSRVGVAYYLTTCKSFSALSSSYSKEMNSKYGAYLKAAKNTTYTRKIEDFSGTRWPKLMHSSFGCTAWTNTKLSTKASGSVTSATQVKNMANSLATKLKTLNNKVDEFCEEVNKVVNNTNSSRYWGFSTDLKVEIVKFVSTLNTKSVSLLKSFANNTNTALSTATNVVSSDLASLSKIRFS